MPLEPPHRNCARWIGLACLLFLAAAHSAIAGDVASGKKAFKSGAYREAVELLTGVKNQPELCEASFYLGLSQYRLGQVDEAIIALEIAADCPGAPAEVGLALGQAYLEKGDHNRAAIALERVLSQEPDNVHALRSLSSLFLRHELNDKAIPLLERLTAKEPADVQSVADLGAAYAGVMNLPKAREQFDIALRSDPDHVAALVGLSNVYIKSGEADSAHILLNRAIAAGGHNYEPYFLRAIVHARAKRYQQAVADLLQAISLGGSDPEIYFHLSRVYQALGEAEKSEKARKRFQVERANAAELAENARQAGRLTQDAKILVKQGNLRGAAEVLEQATALPVQDPQLYYRLASLYLDLGDLNKASETIRISVGLAPAEWTYHYLLGIIESKRGNLQEASGQFEIAARLNGKGAEIFNALGKVAMRQQMYKDAVRWFDRAVQLRPDDQAFRADLEEAQRSIH